MDEAKTIEKKEWTKTTASYTEQGIDELARSCCALIPTVHTSKLRRFDLFKKMKVPIEECVKLAKRLGKTAAKYDFRISEIVFKFNYKTEVSQSQFLTYSSGGLES